MKKVFAIFASIILSGVVFTGCKKGEGDPAISLHTRKGRLTGDWVISEGKMTSTSTNSSSITTWSGTSVQMTQTSGSSSVTGTGTGSYKLSIVKDGTWKMDVSMTITYAGTPSFTAVSTESSSGTWNWTGKVGELKNKSQMVMTMLTRTYTDASGTDIETYTGGDAPSTIYDIYELKNKELIFKWEGTTLNTSGSSSSTSSSSGEMTFTQ